MNSPQFIVLKSSTIEKLARRFSFRGKISLTDTSFMDFIEGIKLKLKGKPDRIRGLNLASLDLDAITSSLLVSSILADPVLSKEIVHVDLSQNNIENCDLLANVLKNHPNVQDISLAGNPINDDSFSSLLAMLGPQLISLHCWKTQINKISTTDLKFGEELKEINFGDCKFGQEGLAVIIDALTDNIERLYLWNCGITSIPKLSFARFQKLKHLNISQNNIGNEGFENILSCNLQSLKSLLANRCQISSLKPELLRCYGDLTIELYMNSVEENSVLVDTLKKVPRIDLNGRFNLEVYFLRRFLQSGFYRITILLLGARRFPRLGSTLQSLPIELIRKILQEVYKGTDLL